MHGAERGRRIGPPTLHSSVAPSVMGGAAMVARLLPPQLPVAIFHRVLPQVIGVQLDAEAGPVRHV